MAEQDEQPTGEQRKELGWYRWPGVAIYGATKDAPPPDYLAAVDFVPARDRTASPGTAGSIPAQAQNPAPAQGTAPAPPPMPPPEWLPPPIGPAMTPDDRAQQLGIVPPQPPVHPGVEPPR